MPVRMISPRTRRSAAAGLCAATLVGWPLSLILTDEPPYILSLSWVALTLTSLDIWATTDVRAKDD